jgi:exodeoxyribonuclease V beta subunit
MMMQHKQPTPAILDPLRFPLSGSRLIEASAGTGKTWTIAALYLRFILGHQPALGDRQDFALAKLPAEILVMTFTRAATRELSERIRDRLTEAAQYFRGEISGQGDDSFLQSLRADYPEGPLRDHAGWRLAMAAESMDEAAVHTIDAWCQRMLKEHAFDSGCLFDEELVADEDVLRAQACQDYWRQQCYRLSEADLQSVLSVWAGVHRLIRDMKSLLTQDVQEQERGAGLSLAECIAAERSVRHGMVHGFKQDWKDRIPQMRDWLDQQTTDPVLKTGWNAKKIKRFHYEPWLATFEAWCQDEKDVDKPVLKTGWSRFTPEGMQEARQEAAGCAALPSFFEDFERFIQAWDRLPSVDDAARRHAAVWITRRLAKLKRQSGTFGFADMLHRLDQALLSPGSGERLRQRIQKQYPVALIDEFQDTSPLQFRIFDQIYQTQSHAEETALLLIGDPKQSIYGFRGADIYSYLRARRATQGRHYVLDTNFRSTEPVVQAVNHLFARVDENKNRHDGAFRFRTQDDHPLPFVRVHAKGRAEHFRQAGGRVPALTFVHSLSALQSNDDLRDTFSALCAEQVVTWLNDGQAGFAQENQQTKALRPADIAILVRTGKEADAVRVQLRKRGVASVYLSDQDSVFESKQARDLYHWLRAVSMPRHVRLVRAALATPLIGLTLQQLSVIAQKEEEFDFYAEQLRDLQSVWQTQGVLAMLRRTLHQFGLPALWLKQQDGERSLTNFLHLAELLQAASTNLEGEQALIRWFNAQLDEQAKARDEQILRLESDDDLVKVITIHKSKGLEYPVVLLPFVTSFRAAQKKDSCFFDVPDEKGDRHLILTLNDEMTRRADDERLKEDLRLLYVGLTRARHALWVGFSAVKVGNAKDCQSHRSAIGFLLNGDQPLVHGSDWLGCLEDYQQELQAWLQGQAKEGALTPPIPVDEYVRLVQAPERAEIETTHLARKDHLPALLDPPRYQADFDKNWSIASFSRITKDIARIKTQLSPLQAPQPADDEPDADGESDTLPITVARDDPSNQAGLAAWHAFHKGPVAGNFLHDQLEWLAGENFALADRTELVDRLRWRCESAGQRQQADVVVQWLLAVSQTKLHGPDVALSALKRVLPEMEFWLPTTFIQTAKLDALCHQYLLGQQARPKLPERQLHGMLMGYADLVFEHEGRYWVLDYKSNFLGWGDHHYDRASLEHAMAEHRYDMQAALYMLALHRLLQKRLADRYDPAQHLGGAVYLFLRGIQGPENGVYLVPPSIDMLSALDQMLDQGALSA